MRILYVTESLGLGGANQTTVTVATEMKRRGHEVLLASEPGPLQSILDNAGVPFLSIDTQGRPPSSRIQRQIFRILKTQRIDLICTTDLNTTFGCTPPALISHVPVFPTYAGLFLPPYPQPWFPQVNVFSEELAEHYVRLHKWKSNCFCNLIARIDGTRFNLGLSGASLKEELGIADHSFIITMVCRQHYSKIGGIDAILEVALDLKKLIPPLQIVFFGDGPERDKVLKGVERVNETARCRFVLAPGSTIRTPEVYAMADVVLANGARSALEGMACGKPVVSVGSNGFCGVIYEKSVKSFRRFNFDKGHLIGNPINGNKNLIETLLLLYKRPDVRDMLGSFSYRYAKGNLVVQSCGEQYDQTYEHIINDLFPIWPWKRILFRWSKSVTLLYWQWVKGLFSKKAANWRERLAEPVEGIEPEWESGILQ